MSQLDGLQRVVLGILPVADRPLEDMVPRARGRALEPPLGVIVDPDDHEHLVAVVQHGADALGLAAAGIRTPVMDRLAKDGMTGTRSASPQPAWEVC